MGELLDSLVEYLSLVLKRKIEEERVAVKSPMEALKLINDKTPLFLVERAIRYARSSLEYYQASARNSVSLVDEMLGDRMVNTINGPVRLSEVPRTPDGQIDPEWAKANCACEQCRARRDKETQTGQYL